MTKNQSDTDRRRAVDTELRMLSGGELRAYTSARPRISGYGAIFDSEADIGPYREVIRKGTFARAIRERQDVRALLNHDSNCILGRTKSGTLALSEDDRGLRFVCELPDTSIGHDVLESVKRGDITGCSFGFRCVKDEWSRDRSTRELRDVDLLDVGPVTFPSYDQTSVQARSAAFGLDRVGGIYRVNVADVCEEEIDLLRARLRLARML
jgi:HK97 family phage prohead protease